MSEEVILTNVTNKVATLTFNRPDKLNALSRDLIFQSIECLKAWSADPGVGAIVITGSGRAFCAGGDVSMMASEGMASEGMASEGMASEGMAREGDAPQTLPQTLEQQIDGLRQAQELSWLLYNIPKVTIAAVNGFAMGAGLGVCLACDLRIASDQSKFGTAYAKVGFGGDFGTTWLLARHVGAAKAKELFFLGDIVGAAEAHRLGLVNRVVAHESLTGQVNEIASRIAHGPLVSYRYMKANVNL
ncbi:MAG: enoyl-CoA hydratase-related protein, partial [Acidobacteriota bacterium]|nr:enoyl-CoA hydratase-related protein [Acidobacteriota bacterium]